MVLQGDISKGNQARLRENRQMSIQDKITYRIMVLVSQGQDVKSAIDTVLGEGTASKMIGEVYDALRAKSAA